MKKLLSLILAIALVATFLPTFAFAAETETTVATDIPGTVEYLPSATLTDSTFAVTATNPNQNYTLTNDSCLKIVSMRVQRIALDRTRTNNGYAPYVGIKVKIAKPGKYILSLKNVAPDDLSKQTSVAAGVYFFAAAETDTITTYDSRSTDVRSTFIGTDSPLAYFDFSNAPTGVYTEVKGEDGKAIELSVDTAGDYYIALSFNSESLEINPMALKSDAAVSLYDVEGFTNEDGTLKFSEMTKSNTAHYQQMHLGGIKLTPVQEMYFDNTAITNTKYYNEEKGKDTEGDCSKWTVSGASGWTANTDLSRVASFSAQEPLDGMFKLNLTGTSSNKKPWTDWNPGQNNSTNARKTILTVDSTFALEEGTYKIKFTGGKFNKGGRMFIYVNEKFAGVYDSYDEATESPTLAPEVTLNTLNLTPGEDGTVTVSFRLAEPEENDRTCAILSKLSFEKVEVAPTPEAIVIEKFPEALEAESVAPISAYVKMSDGSKRFLCGLNRYDGTNSSYTYSADSDKENYIDIAVSDNLEFVPDYASGSDSIKTGIFTNASGIASGTLTAVSGGDAAVTVTAKVDGVEVPAVTKTITVPSNLPGEAADNTVKVYIPSVTGGTITVTGATLGSVSDVAAGKTVTVKAVADDGYQFAYWKDNEGGFVSDEDRYSFNPYTNTSLIAVFDNVSEDNKTVGVEFFDGNRTYLGFKAATAGATFETVEKPTNYGLYGLTFKGWSVENEEIINSLVRAVALYNDQGSPVSGITVNGTAKTANYDDAITETVEGATVWYRDEKPVAYGDTYTYLAWSGTAITSSTDTVTEKAPLAVLNNNGASYMLEYDKGDYTIVDAGILFGDDTHNTVGSCYYKARVKSIKDHGQFTAKANADGTAGLQTTVRGYVIFKDASNNLRVIYAD